jgi:glycosyltransferase involved in cell wall biosynthesis
MNICVLVPAYNEKAALGNVVKAVLQHDLDVVVIDDGSTDGSGTIAATAGAYVLRNDHRMGKGFSLRKGFTWAVKQGYDGVITLDGDGQHDPADLDNFLQKAMEQPSSVIVGNRMQATREMPILRRMTNRIMSGLISYACHVSIPDTQCGYRYIGAEVLRSFEFMSGDFEIETEILMKASRKGFPIFNVPVKTIYRDEKSKIKPFKDTIRFIIYFYREIFSGDN